MRPEEAARQCEGSRITTAQTIKPDLAIAVDVCVPYDIPGMSGQTSGNYARWNIAAWPKILRAKGDISVQWGSQGWWYRCR